MTNQASYEVPRYRLSLVREGSGTYAAESVGHSEAAARVIGALLADCPTERIVVVYLNGANKIVGSEIVAQGGQSGCSVAPSEVFRGAIVACARAIVVGHNHPSGDPTASRDDVTMTRAMVQAGAILGIPVLDHVIVTPDGGPWAAMRDSHSAIF
jgi:DNA repair protein RadC